MKKVILSLCVVLVLVWSSDSVFAKGNGRGGQGKKTSRVQEKTKVREIKTTSTKERGKDKDNVVEKGLGKGHKQQLEAIKKQFVREEAKHLKRKARLERIRELAVEEENTKVVERIDKLLGKEQQRYDRKQQRMQKRQQKTLQSGEKGLSEKSSKTTEEGAKEKRGKGKRQDKAKEKSKADEKDTDEDVEKETEK